MEAPCAHERSACAHFVKWKPGGIEATALGEAGSWPKSKTDAEIIKENTGDAVFLIQFAYESRRICTATARIKERK